MTSETFKNLAEGAGFIAAAGFFLYRSISGYLITNISIEPSYDRQPIDSDKDYLIVRVKLSKGDRGSVELHDAQIQIICQDRPPIRVPLIGVDRRSYQPHPDSSTAKAIDWDCRSETSPRIRLSPGEESVFAACCIVPASEYCEVEVAILGKRHFSWKYGQWRSSLVSLPRT